MPARYTVKVVRPDLVARAERELGITDARAWTFEGRWVVQGRNGRGRWRLFVAGEDWVEITSGDGDEIREEFEELVEKLEQGRLL